ncbi:hypothetical protein M513_10702, partial [Trichuris suis]
MAVLFSFSIGTIDLRSEPRRRMLRTSEQKRRQSRNGNAHVDCSLSRLSIRHIKRREDLNFVRSFRINVLVQVLLVTVSQTPIFVNGHFQKLKETDNTKPYDDS